MSLDYGLEWDDNALSWTGTDTTSYSYLQGKYQDWIKSGGAGTYEYWHDVIWDHNAAGTDNWRGGLTWVGENGPELALLPRGTQITSASESRELGGDTFNIYVDARNIRELNDLVRIAQNARMNARKAVS